MPQTSEALNEVITVQCFVMSLNGTDKNWRFVLLVKENIYNIGVTQALDMSNENLTIFGA